MNAQLPSHLIVSGLLRAVAAAGGNGAILRKGHAHAGSLLVVLTSRGADPELFERTSQLSGGLTWNKVERRESWTNQRVARFIDEMQRFDRDFWALELDVANREQFIVDSLGQT